MMAVAKRVNHKSGKLGTDYMVDGVNVSVAMRALDTVCRKGDWLIVSANATRIAITAHGGFASVALHAGHGSTAGMKIVCVVNPLELSVGLLKNARCRNSIPFVFNSKTRFLAVHGMDGLVGIPTESPEAYGAEHDRTPAPVSNWKPIHLHAPVKQRILSMPANQLRERLDAVAFAVGMKESRYAINGVAIAPRNGKRGGPPMLVATDARMLCAIPMCPVRTTESNCGVSDSGAFIIPCSPDAPGVPVLLRVLMSDRVLGDDNKAFMVVERSADKGDCPVLHVATRVMSFAIRPLEGTYPKWQDALPQFCNSWGKTEWGTQISIGTGAPFYRQVEACHALWDGSEGEAYGYNIFIYPKRKAVEFSYLVRGKSGYSERRTTTLPFSALGMILDKPEKNAPECVALNGKYMIRFAKASMNCADMRLSLHEDVTRPVAITRRMTCGATTMDALMPVRLAEK